MSEGQEAKIGEVKDFFGMTTKEFMEQWKCLDDDSKQQIRVGIGNGSFNY